jgi:hypothetical protein
MVWLIWAACMAAVQSAPAPNQKVVEGRVVDAEGKPIEGAVVSTQWKSADRLSPAGPTFRSAADGAFSAAVAFHRRPIALMAFHAERNLAGVAVLDEKTIDEPLTIRMGPLVEIAGELRCPELEKLPSGIEVGLSALPNYVALMGAALQEGKFVLRVPPGEYQFYARGPITLVELVSRKLSIGPDKPRIDLAFVDLTLTPLGRHQGKEPPAWNVTAARGAEASVTLAEFKGRWLLIEFWGYW